MAVAMAAIVVDETADIKLGEPIDTENVYNQKEYEYKPPAFVREKENPFGPPGLRLHSEVLLIVHCSLFIEMTLDYQQQRHQRTTTLPRPEPRVRPPSRRRKTWRSRFRYQYRRIARLGDSPQRLARGLATGVFAGCFPFFGLQTLIGVALAYLVRGNKLMAAVGTWVSNPLTYVPIFMFNFKVGQWILGSTDAIDPDRWDNLDVLLAMGGEFIGILLVGCAVVGLTLAIVSYTIGLHVIRRARRMRP